jgi:hypothetical protein
MFVQKVGVGGGAKSVIGVFSDAVVQGISHFSAPHFGLLKCFT